MTFDDVTEALALELEWDDDEEPTKPYSVSALVAALSESTSASFDDSSTGSMTATRSRSDRHSRV